MKLVRALSAALQIGLAALLPNVLAGQGVNTAATGSQAVAALQVFLDCPAGCDFDFLRREITYVNWVRDRQDADLHLLITAEGTGGGGRVYILKYIGLRQYQKLTDELRFATRESDTGDEVRRQLTQRIALGLVPYLAHGSRAGQIRIGFADTASAVSAAPLHDPWNYWVFRIGGAGSLSGESQTKSSRVSGYFSASRVTEAWKYSFSGNASYSHTTYTLSDGTTFPSILKSYSSGASITRSLGGHWALNLQAGARHSTWENYDLFASVSPGIEFDVFPYTDFSRRQLLFVYAVGLNRAQYTDTTIFNKLEETRPTQRFVAAASATQPWGYLSAQIKYSSYLDKMSQNRFSVDVGTSIRIARGLNFDIDGGYSRVRDQISLLKGGLTDEEILLQLRQLRTAYYYYADVGLSFTFGSKTNNVVNPRFSR
jgi:hypothetical protein